MPSKYITIRVLRQDLERVRRALNSHEFLGGTSVIRWFHWLSFMTGNEILAGAKLAGPRQATYVKEQLDAGRDQEHLLNDTDDEAEAKRLDVEDQE